MPLVIDTYNVLHTVGVLPPDLAGLEIEGLVRLISGSRYRDEKTTLVCDGLPDGPKPNQSPPVTVRFAGRDRTADDLIGQIVRSSSAPRRLMVVSSDHAVQRTARKRRCKILTSQEFLQQLADDAVAAGTIKESHSADRKPQGMSEEQVERWVKIFEIDERIASIPSRGKSSRSTQSVAAEGESDAASDQAPLPRHIPELSPGQEVSESLIEQAERMWKESHKTKPNQQNG
jgi:uncharacterized protein